MKKVLVLGQVLLQDAGSGVTQKMLSQAKAFASMGAKVDCIGYYKDTIAFYCFFGKNRSGPHTLASIQNPRLKRFSFWHAVSRYVAKQAYDLIYLRYPSIDFQVLQTLKKIRKHCRHIVLEIPSYPLICFDSGFFNVFQFWLSHLLHPICRHIFDKVIYVGNPSSEIFGIPAQQIPNGIPEAIRDLPSTGFHLKKNSVCLFCVSNMFLSHGYDRLVQGLGNYYASAKQPPVQVELLFVGDGPCRPVYESLAKELCIPEHVKFLGPLQGDALTAAYREASVGIGPLGLYRKGYQEASTLKTKEYLIRGLPFVYAGTEIGLDADFPFALQIPNDEQPVSIEAILDFVDSFSSLGSETVAAQMRSYAEEHFSWEIILRNACGEYLK